MSHVDKEKRTVKGRNSLTWVWPMSTREDYIECVLVWLSFRSIDGVIRDRSVWQLPENVSYHHSIHVTSPVVHMEGSWMWRWACNSQFKIPYWATSYHCFCVLFLKKITDFMHLSVWSWRPRCHCERYISAEEICNTTCLSRLPRILGHFSQDGRLLLSLSERNNAIWVSDKWHFYGFILLQLQSISAQGGIWESWN